MSPSVRHGALLVFVMSHKMWLQRSQQDPDVLGRISMLNGTPGIAMGIGLDRFAKLGADVPALSRGTEPIRQ